LVSLAVFVACGCGDESGEPAFTTPNAPLPAEASGDERSEPPPLAEATMPPPAPAPVAPPEETVLLGTDEAPPAPPAQTTLTDAHGYRIDIARSASGEEVWVTYGRLAGVAPRVEYARLGTRHRPPEGVAFRIVPAWGGRYVREHGGFHLLRDDQPGTASPLGRTPEPRPIRRAARVPGSPADDAAALAATTRLLELDRCPAGARSCHVYGTDDELRAEHARQRVEREGRDGWRIDRAPMPRGPAALDETLTPSATATVHGQRVELHVVPAGESPRENVAPHALFVRTAAGAATLLFTFTAYQDPVLAVGAVEVGDRALAWVWEPDFVSYGAVFFDPATGARLGEPLVVRDRSDTSDVDCGNVFTDTRPVAVLVEGEDALSVALTWSSEDRAVFFDRLGRPGRFVTAHQPGDLPYPDGASVMPPIFALRGAPTAADAYLEPLVGTQPGP
jgi:hypothetical protein